MWTEERIEVLTRMWGEGTPAKVIGDHVGATKNAVIGKAHRIGLPFRGKGFGSGRPRQTGKRKDHRYEPGGSRYLPPENRVRFRRSDGGLAAGAKTRTSRIRQEPPSAPDMLMLSILDLESTSCRFPIGDPKQPGFAFCGASKPVEHSYCPFHRALAYQPMESQGRRNSNVRYLTRRFG